jgi:hypothetical protein
MPNFKPDANVKKVAEAYSLDAIDIASRNFRVNLDWTDASIESVERMLKTLHEQMASAKPDDKTIWTFAKAFGSYIGEVYRKRYGGEWGVVELGSDTFPGMKAAKGVEFWPWGKVYQRLVKGPENNVWHYYQSLTASE